MSLAKGLRVKDLGRVAHKIRNLVLGLGSLVLGRRRPLPYRFLRHIICGSGGYSQWSELARDHFEGGVARQDWVRRQLSTL